MSSRWSFKSLPGKQFELILLETAPYSSEHPYEDILYRTGYVSSNLADILKAQWYLNSGINYGLPEKNINILNYFKRYEMR